MCQYRILKILIIISNVINLTFGMTLILMGSYVHLFLSTYIADIHVHILSLTFAMIALGCLLFSIGSIGVLSVWTGRRAIIIIYIGLLTVYVISGILIVITTLNIRSKVGILFHDVIQNAANQYKIKNSSRRYIDTIQKQHKCCGVTSYQDYTACSMPASCFPADNGGPYENGCLAQLDGYIQQCLLFIMTCILTCIPIEIASAITAILLSVKRETISWKEQITFC
uniref:Tetraspanin n=1 Tax=Trichobilharzia regenti TaxID=157069 RepID=A0AA85JKW4_TRIRE|nr:unnamed protein product [Trichobilharzia regenti]